jgi:hypothetical protein
MRPETKTAFTGALEDKKVCTFLAFTDMHNSHCIQNDKYDTNRKRFKNYKQVRKLRCHNFVRVEHL